jgi:hypothetical protein
MGDDIKMDLREIGWSGMDWIGLTQNRDHWRDLLKTVMNFLVGKFLSSLANVGF